MIEKSVEAFPLGLRVLRSLPPVGGNDPDIEQCGQLDAPLDVDLILAAVPSSNQRGSRLHARGLHRGFLFYGHKPNRLFSNFSGYRKRLLSGSRRGNRPHGFSQNPETADPERRSSNHLSRND